ncbi:unnamed protein product [Prunus brigantina]
MGTDPHQQANPLISLHLRLHFLNMCLIIHMDLLGTLLDGQAEYLHHNQVLCLCHHLQIYQQPIWLLLLTSHLGLPLCYPSTLAASILPMPVVAQPKPFMNPLSSFIFSQTYKQSTIITLELLFQMGFFGINRESLALIPGAIQAAQ